MRTRKFCAARMDLSFFSIQHFIVLGFFFLFCVCGWFGLGGRVREIPPPLSLLLVLRSHVLLSGCNPVALGRWLC